MEVIIGLFILALLAVPIILPIVFGVWLASRTRFGFVGRIYVFSVTSIVVAALAFPILPDAPALTIALVLVFPLAPAVVLLMVFEAAQFGFWPAIWTGLAAWAVVLVLLGWVRNWPGIALAALLGPIIVVMITQVQARASDSHLASTAAALGADCVRIRGFTTAFVGAGTIDGRLWSSDYHGVARVGERYYIWSYQLDGWDEVDPAKARMQLVCEN